MKITALSIFLWLFCAALIPNSTEFPPKSKIYFIIGSDWCNSCKKMHQNLINDSSFNKQLKSLNLNLEIIDFPRKTNQPDSIKSKNAKLSEQLKFKGKFPSIYLQKGDSDEFIEIEYGNENTKEFMTLLMKLNQ